jgi:O-antigen/teichoic acid export membrane protein
MDNLKENTSKGLFWSMMKNGIVQLLNVIIGILLGRLLSPAEFGIMGILSIFTFIAGNLQNSGFLQGLINLKSPTHRDYNSVFWFNILASLSIYAILFISAPLIAWFFNEPRLITLSRFVFLGSVISSLNIAPTAYLRKELMMREIAISTTTALFFSGAVGVTLAFNGYTYWSLAWQQVLFFLFEDIGLYYYSGWRPRWKLDFGPVKKMFSFGVKILFTNVINSISYHILTVFFGRWFPLKNVGNYTQANGWNTKANNFISGTVGQIAQTVFVSVADEQEREKRVMRKMMRFTAFISFPCIFGLALVAKEFIVLALTERWIDSAVLLQILCIGGAFVPFYTMYQNLVISKGRSDIYLRLNVIQIVLQITIILALHSLGMVPMIFAYSLFLIIWLLAWQRIIYKMTGITLWETLQDICPFMLIAAAVMLVTWFCTQSITNNWLLLITRILMAASLYLVVMKLSHAVIMDECIQFFLKKTKTRS